MNETLTPPVPRPRDSRIAGYSDVTPLRHLAERAFSRAAGAPLMPGNSVRLLKDAVENYPAWFSAIEQARHKIYFECYLIEDDAVGVAFAQALMEKARAGVRVRVIYDWFGCFRTASGYFWRSLREAGVEVRSFNSPSWDDPIGWLSRDHRKMLTVDGEVAFVSGLCVSRRWMGDPLKARAPWRDTGVELRGPAVADVEQAFAQVWTATGEAFPLEELTSEEDIAHVGAFNVRVVASQPSTARIFRLDQLIAVVARKSLWLTDAYFIGMTTYVSSLCAAARDHVDVRLLVPGATDLPLVRPVSRAGYRPLLESGVRIFEWNGPMLHAKTAVADGRWARVGSSNLNLASWVGNYELDVAVEDEGFARDMEMLYEQDLANATEIVLTPRHRVRPAARSERHHRRNISGMPSKAAMGALRWAHTMGAAMTHRRSLDPGEAGPLVLLSLSLLGLALLLVAWPWLLTIPLGFLALWFALSFLSKAYRLARRKPLKNNDRM